MAGSIDATGEVMGADAGGKQGNRQNQFKLLKLYNSHDVSLSASRFLNSLDLIFCIDFCLTISYKPRFK